MASHAFWCFATFVVSVCLFICFGQQPALEGQAIPNCDGRNRGDGFLGDGCGNLESLVMSCLGRNDGIRDVCCNTGVGLCSSFAGLNHNLGIEGREYDIVYYPIGTSEYSTRNDMFLQIMFVISLERLDSIDSENINSFEIMQIYFPLPSV